MFNYLISFDIWAFLIIYYSSLTLSRDEFLKDDAFVFMIFVIAMNIVVFTFLFLSVLSKYLLPAFPLYKMAKNAGYDKPWLVFIPYGKTYISFILPLDEYNYFEMFKTYNRSTAFWIYFSLDFFSGIIKSILGMVPFFGIFLTLFFEVGKNLMHYGEYRDLLKTYGQKKETGWIAGIGVFFPVVYWVFLYLRCKNEPEFGFHNFYEPIIKQEI